MSTPPNILDSYTSHAYHHVLIATNTTDLAERLVNQSSTELFNIDQTFFRDTTKPREVTPKYLDEENKSGGSYVVLINSAQDVDYYINDISWTDIFLPREMGPDGNPVVPFSQQCSEGTMIITEPRGAKFFQFLNDVCDALQTDPVGVIFILKTFFVGTLDPNLDGSINPDIPQIITHVKPFSFVIYDIINEFSNVGSTYTISFIGTVNGVSKFPLFSRLPSGTSSTGGKTKALDISPVNQQNNTVYMNKIRGIVESTKTKQAKLDEIKQILNISDITIKINNINQTAESLADYSRNASKNATWNYIAKPPPKESDEEKKDKKDSSDDEASTIARVMKRLEIRWNEESYRNYREMESRYEKNLLNFHNRMASIDIIVDSVYQDVYDNTHTFGELTDADKKSKTGVPSSTPRSVEDSKSRMKTPKEDIDLYVVKGMAKGEKEAAPNRFNIVFEPDATVEDAINDIMSHCEKVLDEKTNGVLDEATNTVKFYDYRITTKLKSTLRTNDEKDVERRLKQINDDDPTLKTAFNGIFEMQYYIHRVEIPQKDASGVSQLGTGDSADQLQKDAANNALVFDYIFTGENIDIIDMEMKMDMGYLAFTSLKPVNGDKQPTNSEVRNTNDTTAGVVPKAPFYTPRAYSPIGPSYVSTSDNKVNQKPLAVKYANARNLLNQLAIFSAIDAKVTIRGNPQLLNDTNYTIPNNSTTTRVINDLSKHFGLVRINIRMLDDSLEQTDMSGISSSNPNVTQMYSTPFWYQDYYIITAVENKFSEGEFTQVLDLIALVSNDTLSKLYGDENSKTVVDNTAPTATTLGGAQSTGQTTSTGNPVETLNAFSIFDNADANNPLSSSNE